MSIAESLPLHPLFIHLPVVLIPAFIATVSIYLLIPRLRHRIGWLMSGLAVIAAVTTLIGWWSGHQFYDQHVEMISAAGADTGKFTTMLADHLSYGDIIVWLVPATAALALVFGFLDRKRRHVDTTQSTSSTTRTMGFVMIGLATATLVMAVASGWLVFQTGHSGAEVVWSPEGK